MSQISLSQETIKHSQKKNITPYFDIWQLRAAGFQSQNSGNTHHSTDIFSDIDEISSTSDGGIAWTSLKLKPENLKEETELQLKLTQDIKSKKLEFQLLKKKKEALIKKWQFILAEFSVYLTKIGKKHLIKDCILDCTHGKILFLSKEVLEEFLNFRPDIKNRLRWNSTQKPRPR